MKITLTGVDERTPFNEIGYLLQRGAEIGVLYTETPEGRHRYPSIEWMVALFHAVPSRYALHVCGSAARRHIMAGNRPMLTEHVQRIQLNGNVSKSELMTACRLFCEHEIIVQNRPGNPLQSDRPNHAVLVDASGGRGISPTVWTRPDTANRVGFAGGLGADNLEYELPRIVAVAAGSESWIDMEGKLRAQGDWFSSQTANIVIDIFERMMRCSTA